MVLSCYINAENDTFNLDEFRAERQQNRSSEEGSLWGIYSLNISGASGEEVHKAGVQIRLCRLHRVTRLSKKHPHLSGQVFKQNSHKLGEAN